MREWCGVHETVGCLIVAAVCAVGWALDDATPAPALNAHPALIGTVSTVTDGDTLRLDVDGREVRVRLYGVDCPEMDQPRGIDARNYTAAMVERRRVTAFDRGQSWGRTVAAVSDDRLRDVGLSLVESGLAWWDGRYAPESTEYGRRLRDAQRAAQSAKIGVWGDSEQTAPWTWRAGK